MSAGNTPNAVQSSILPPFAPDPPTLDALVERLSSRLSDAGAAVHRAADAASARRIIATTLIALSARLVRVADDDAVREVLAGAAEGLPNVVEVGSDADDAARRELASAGASVRGCTLASAESGRCWQDTRHDDAQAAHAIQILPLDAIAYSEAACRAIIDFNTLRGSPSARARYQPAQSPAGQRHVILLDNGRTSMAADDGFRPALACVDCGACAEVCAPLHVIATPNEAPPTPIGLIRQAWQRGVEAAPHLDACLGCGDCATACPVAIPVPDLLVALRGRRTSHRSPRNESMLDRLRRRAPAKTNEPAGTLAQCLAQRWGVRSAEQPFRSLLSERERQGAVLRPRADSQLGAPVMRAALFAGCVAETLVPDAAAGSAAALQRAGYEVVVPPRQRCCGLHSYLRGDNAAASRFAAETVDATGSARVDAVVFPSPACAGMIRRHYTRLLRRDPARYARAQWLAARTATLTEAIERLHPGTTGAVDGVPLHPACGAARWLGMGDAHGSPEHGGVAESALAAPCGVDWSGEAPANVTEALPTALLSLPAVRTAGRLLVEDSGCLAHLRRIAQRNGVRIKVEYVAAALESRLRNGNR